MFFRPGVSAAATGQLDLRGGAACGEGPLDLIKEEPAW